MCFYYLILTAAVGGNRHAAEKLLRHTQQLIDVRDKDGKTALMTSVVNGHMELVHLLLEKGADISIKNEVCLSVSHLCVCQG